MDVKQFDWLVDRGLGYAISIYFVFWFTREIRPAIAKLAESIEKLTLNTERLLHDREEVKEIFKLTISEGQSQARIENKIDKLISLSESVAKSLYKND